MPVEIEYRALQKRHAECDLEYWRELRALYEGGKALLRNPEILDKIFPRHADEPQGIYEERKRRAFYVPQLSTVIDKIIAELACDEIKMAPPGQVKGEPVELDDFWQAYLKDCSPPGGERQSFGELTLEQARTGLLLGRAWTLDEMPASPEVAPTSEGEQRAAGQLRAYSCQVPPECVLDWDDGKDGALRWAKTCFVARHQEDPFTPRVLVHETYTVYTADRWFRFEVVYDADQARQGGDTLRKPQPQDKVPSAAEGQHSFARVPLIRMRVPPGLWAGNKLHSLAIEYLNKSCGLSWAEYKALFAQLYEFLAPALPGIDSPINEHQEDSARARRQPRGPGLVQERGSEDRAEYVSPPTESFEHAAKGIDRVEEAMYRVMYQMALAEDNSGAVIRRSADSKEIDHSVSRIIARAVGKQARAHAVDVVDTAAIGRGDMKPGAEGWTASGMEGAEDGDVGVRVEQAVVLEGVAIPSPTFQRVWKKGLARRLVAGDATEEELRLIDDEIEENVTAEDHSGAPAPAKVEPEPDDDDQDELPPRRSGYAA